MAELRVAVRPDDHSTGPLDAPLTLVEYGDYECPHCGRAFPVVKQLQETLAGRLRFVFRNFPLSQQHPHAVEAALAAEAAARQDAFWPMHDHLFTHQHRLDDDSLRRYAADLGLDPTRFDRDLRDSALADRVRADFNGGVRSGVNGTPTFFINGVRSDVGYGYDALLERLRAALKSAAGARAHR